MTHMQNKAVQKCHVNVDRHL